MKPYVYQEGMSVEEQKDGAYWERNLLALAYANRVNRLFRAYMHIQHIETFNLPCGWYVDTDNNWDGWKRVISLDNGRVTFHVPDAFDLGDLPEIQPNWDGHSTEQKWIRVMRDCGIALPIEPITLPPEDAEVTNVLEEARQQMMSGLGIPEKFFEKKEEIQLPNGLRKSSGHEPPPGGGW